ncbi:hypothetical protein P691DRAFT_777171 [Macrolepiota fuliginosa MF-IS2]|uniref:Transmembrane protein n=1 Tax=Macrolepiota fuliginosa MF-IS2 TaxID=1400762 RepID=A0A9P6C1T6_9AGAR|nr:hypothetical protein P691DRAFT_777171 [Macrolepiota fuliginosa MF-IS2]
MNTTTPTVQTPLPLYTRDSFASSSSSVESNKPETDLHTFGYTFTASPNTDSRHDRRLSVTSEAQTLPPAYSESHKDVVPEYSATYEPATLAMYLFRFGFLFPPFWIMGALILFTPLRAPTSTIQDEETGMGWLPEKTEAEKQAFISHIRKAELKWAKRCLVALVIFAVVVGIVAGAAVWATAK